MVYKEKSFTKAAKKMYVTQPCLSAMVKKVETRLGTPIFNRNVSPIQLTECGKVYIDYVQQVMALEEQLENYLCDIRGLKKGEVAIGSNNVCTSFVLPKIIKRFTELHPDIQIQLHEGSVTYLEEQLHNGLLDIVLDNYSVDESMFETIPLRTEYLMIALPRQWKDSVRNVAGFTAEDIKRNRHLEQQYIPASLESFSNLPFIILRKGNDTRNRFEQLCLEEDIKPPIFMEVDQLSTAYNIACSGIAATLVSDTLIQNMPALSDTLQFYCLPSKLTRRQLFFHYPRNRYVNLAMQRFIREAVEGEV